jgi:tight adherence protein C
MTEMMVLFFSMILAGIFGAGYLFLRVRGREAAAVPDIPLMAGPVNGEESLHEGVQELLTHIGGKMAKGGHKEDSLRRQLFQAGYRFPSSYLSFYGAQVCLGLLFALTVGWFTGVGKGSISEALLLAICAGGFGFLVPSRVLEYQVRARANRIRRAVPAALDMLVLAMEAGQSLDQAMKDTASSLKLLYPDLSAEFVFCHLEMSAGTSRAEALRRLGERSPEDELRKLAALMIDGERFGTTLGPALRTHSRFLRTRMRQRAQEKARKLGVKLVIPVFFLIFPSVVLVTLGPAYLQMQKFFKTFLQ